MGGLEQVMSEAPTTTHPLRLPLVCALVLVVDATEVGYDYRDRQGDHQHPTERANSSHDLAGNRLGYHVAVPAHTNNSWRWLQARQNFSPFCEAYVPVRFNSLRILSTGEVITRWLWCARIKLTGSTTMCVCFVMLFVCSFVGLILLCDFSWGPRAGNLLQVGQWTKMFESTLQLQNI